MIKLCNSKQIKLHKTTYKILLENIMVHAYEQTN